MIGFQAVDEAPLCSAPFSYYLDLRSDLTISQAILAGKVYNFALSNALNLIQDEGVARSVDILHTIPLNQVITINGIYNMSIQNVVTLVSNESPKTVYSAAISHPLFLNDNVQAAYVYGLEFCDNIALVQKLGWIIDVSMSNHLTLTMHEMDSMFNELHMQHMLTTNMDDLNCTNPFGTSGDKDLSSRLIITQSLNAKMIYACQTQSQLEILATLAWRMRNG